MSLPTLYVLGFDVRNPTFSEIIEAYVDELGVHESDRVAYVPRADLARVTAERDAARVQVEGMAALLREASRKLAVSDPLPGASFVASDIDTLIEKIAAALDEAKGCA